MARKRPRKRPAEGQKLIHPGQGVQMGATLAVWVSLRTPAVPTVLEVTRGDDPPARYPVLAVRATLERTYRREEIRDGAAPPCLAGHRAMLKAGWVALGLVERLDVVFCYPGRGLMTLAEFRAAEPDATVEVRPAGTGPAIEKGKEPPS
jgi:hypothetical protein